MAGSLIAGSLAEGSVNWEISDRAQAHSYYAGTFSRLVRYKIVPLARAAKSAGVPAETNSRAWPGAKPSALSVMRP
jgi:hypothetical protein